VTNDIPEEVKLALAEILNLASGVAEMQADDAAHAAIYDLLDSVAEYFEIDHQRPLVEEAVETGFTDASTSAANDNPIEIVVRGESDDDLPQPDRDFGK
jgi:competence protein ComGC